MTRLTQDSTASEVRSRMTDIMVDLRRRARNARHSAGRDETLAAAALRGKAVGYSEAADMLASALNGGSLTPKWDDRS